jgi:hypothetical protein
VIKSTKKFLFKNKSLHLEPKVFCIGMNKTGTTSLEGALKQFGYKLGNQIEGELLLHEYGKRNFKTIIDFCHTAEAFQDVPFSLPFLFITLDQIFPNAKFILTIRDSTEQWYNSMVNFHSKIYGGGKIPTEDDLKNAIYRYKGKPWDSNRILFNTPPGQPYHKPTLFAYYENHCYNVREYFRGKSNLLVINVSEDESYLKLCSFLGKVPKGKNFPWLNKT